MTVNPTPYDEIQDGRLDDLESLITAEYQPPAGAQYSYPVASQGITQDQFQLMFAAIGDGAIMTENTESPFQLVGHGSDAETNQRNTLILKVSPTSKRNEAVMNGFYWRQTEDIELPFPPVTTPTTYFVTITYDPRKFKTDPLRLEVWAGTPPRGQGQRHIPIRQVHRQPNQFLSQATITLDRPYVSPTITATELGALPEATDVLYGTLGIVRSRTSGGDVIPGTGQIFESRGIHGWHNLLVGPWQDIPTFFGGWSKGFGVYRRTLTGVDVAVRARCTGAQNPSRPFAFPSGLLAQNFYTIANSTTNSPDRLAISASSGQTTISNGPHPVGTWINYSFSIPDWYLAF